MSPIQGCATTGHAIAYETTPPASPLICENESAEAKVDSQSPLQVTLLHRANSMYCATNASSEDKSPSDSSAAMLMRRSKSLQLTRKHSRSSILFAQSNSVKPKRTSSMALACMVRLPIYHHEIDVFPLLRGQEPEIPQKLGEWIERPGILSLETKNILFKEEDTKQCLELVKEMLYFSGMKNMKEMRQECAQVILNCFISCINSLELKDKQDMRFLIDKCIALLKPEEIRQLREFKNCENLKNFDDFTLQSMLFNRVIKIYSAQNFNIIDKMELLINRKILNLEKSDSGFSFTAFFAMFLSFFSLANYFGGYFNPAAPLILNFLFNFFYYFGFLRYFFSCKEDNNKNEKIILLESLAYIKDIGHAYKSIITDEGNFSTEKRVQRKKEEERI